MWFSIFITWICGLLIGAIAFWHLVGNKPVQFIKWASLSIIPIALLVVWSAW